MILLLGLSKSKKALQGDNSRVGEKKHYYSSRKPADWGKQNSLSTSQLSAVRSATNQA